MWNKLIKTGEDKMTDNINRIGLNTGAANFNLANKDANKAPDDKQPEVKVTQAPPEKVQVSPDAVFAFMAGSASINAPRTYDVAKYVSPESAARIAAMMGQFEGAVTQGLLAIQKEGLPLSEADQLAIAAAMVK